MILNYPGKRGQKTRTLKAQSLSIEDAAIYDLIFHDIPLRATADRIDLSYQGVYIRALDYVRLWVSLGILKFDDNYLKKLTKQNKENMTVAAPPAMADEEQDNNEEE